MTLGHPFLMGPPDDRTRPWRVITDGSQSSGIGFGDARIPPGAPGPGRHVHTHEDEGIYVISGTLTLTGPPDPEVLLDISVRHGVHPVEGPPLTR